MGVRGIRSVQGRRHPLCARVVAFETDTKESNSVAIRSVLPDTCWICPLHWLDDAPRFSGESCIVIRLHSHATPADRARSLVAVRALAHGPPVVLAGRLDAELVRAVSTLRTGGIVWEEDIEAHLWSTIARVRAQGFLDPLLSAMSRDVGVRPALRTALTRILPQPRPSVRVADVAREARCHRTTLSKEWRDARNHHPSWPERLEDLLGWVLVANAVALARPDRKWTWVAGHLGVHTHTIIRLARRLAGLSLSELLHENGAAALDGFVAQMAGGYASAQRPRRQQKGMKGNK